jgi:hypothetical protein
MAIIQSPSDPLTTSRHACPQDFIYPAGRSATGDPAVDQEYTIVLDLPFDILQFHLIEEK